MAQELPDKLPPQSLEAEKSVLGCLMLDKNAIIKVADFLKPKDFYKAIHHEIYKTIIELFEKEDPIDLLSISDRLKDKNLLESGGSDFHGQIRNTKIGELDINYELLKRIKNKLQKL